MNGTVGHLRFRIQTLSSTIDASTLGMTGLKNLLKIKEENVSSLNQDFILPIWPVLHTIQFKYSNYKTTRITKISTKEITISPALGSLHQRQITVRPRWGRT
jgi:hypothetical protein